MLKKLLLCFCLLLNIAALVLIARPELTPNLFTASAASASELKAKQAKLEAEQAQIKSKISQLENNQADAQEQVNEISNLISNLEDQISTANQKIAAQEAEIADIQADIDATEAEIQDSYERFKSRVRSMYIAGDLTGGLELLLSMDDFDSMISTMTYIQVMSEHDSAIVAALTEDKEGFQSQKEKVEQKKAEIVEEKALLSNKKEELDTQKQ